MELSEFIDLHQTALERDQARHNRILGLLGAARDRPERQLRLWTLGSAGQCAVEKPGRPLVLGDLNEKQCQKLAEDTVGLDYPGVIGPDETAPWFVQRATELGIGFRGSLRQGILALNGLPSHPGVPGQARQVGPSDATLFAEWMIRFMREGARHDPLPPREQLEARAGQGQHWFWTLDDEPVSIAGIVRRTRDAAAIAAVYTPPSHRGRGFAGAVVATVVERIFEEGRKIACLYTDLDNPAANRCYAKVGFRPVCNSWLYLRDRA